MLILDSLELRNIGRFVSPQVIDFKRLESPALIEGRNLNTNGSSASAKTTILKALDFLLGLNNISISVLQSRLTEEPIYVCGIGSFNGKPIKIERGKKLLIDLDGEVTTGSSKITEDLLDRILGMPRDLFRKTMHKRQGEGGFFLNMLPSETHKFLTSCLSLDPEQAKIVKLDELLGSLESKKAALGTSLESNKMGLEATNNAVNKMPSDPVSDVTAKDIEDFEQDYESKSAIRKSFTEDVADKKAKLESRIKTVEKIDFEKQNSLKTQILELKNSMNDLNGLESKRQHEVEKQISELMLERFRCLADVNAGTRAKKEAQICLEELKKIKACVCPTCDQSWQNEASKSKEADISYTLRSLRVLVSKAESSKDRISEIESKVRELDREKERRVGLEMTELETKIANLYVQMGDTDSELDDLNKNWIAFNQRTRTEVETLEELERMARRRLESAKDRLSLFESNAKRHEEAIARLTTQIVHYDGQVRQILSELDSIVEQIELTQEAKKAIKTYLSHSFDDALNSISNHATDILRGIPNMATATISLEGIKENANGKVKEEVNAVISMDGEIGVPIKSLSGGEKSATDLAIDLAVISFIGEKTGQGINILALDEFTNGLDTICIQEVMEMLKNSNLDKKILLIEHNPIVSQSIESRVVVERSGSFSKIIQD